MLVSKIVGGLMTFVWGGYFGVMGLVRIMIGTKDLLHVILLMGGRADANHVV